jgi:PAS domain S-box-containing protein
VVATGLPLIGLLVHATRHEYEMALLSGETRAYHLAGATATSARSLVTMVRDILASGARRDASALLDPERCGVTVEDLQGILAFLPNILVADRNGDVMCSGIATERVVSVAERDWFRAILAGASFAVGSPVTGVITRTWVVAVAVPVRGPDGAVHGVLAASLPLLRFQNLLAGVTPGPRDLVTIATGNRVIVARSTNPNAWVGRKLPPPVAEVEHRRSGYVASRAVDAEGVERTWADVEVPGLGWHVYGGIPTAEVMASARANLRQRLLLGGLILLVVAVLAHLLQSMITGSLRHLVAVTGSVRDQHQVKAPPGAPLEVVAVAERFDRTLKARIRAEQEERRAKERFRSIVDNAVLGIYVSTEDGSFLEVNPAFATLMGYDDPRELLAAGPEALYADPSQRVSVMASHRNREIIDGLELDWVRRDGQHLAVRIYGKAITLADGRRAFEIMVEDITERRRLEEQLRTTQKMEAVARLAGGLAHDFNNLLTVIRMNAELAQEEIGEEGAGAATVDELVRAAEGAQQLTRQLLSFSRRKHEPSEPRRVSPNNVIRGVEKMLGRLIGEDVHLTTDLLPELPRVRIDPAQLEHVLLNLAINARDALPEGGTITISTRTAPPPAGASAATDTPWVRISVEDDGVGMTEAVRARIFEPFFTTKDSDSGTGLGLATAYAVVTSAGGRISVESAVDRGTRFEILLPGIQGAQPGDETPPRPKEVRGGTETVLMVEDNAAVRRAVQRALEGAGYDVLVACDGQEGNDLLEGHPGPLDLVITDVVMPKVSGPELADRVEALRPGTPILFMSGYTADHPLAERVARRHVHFIPKPFEISQLLARVRTALSGEDASEISRMRGGAGDDGV